jgi:hypothetical protein
MTAWLTPTLRTDMPNMWAFKPYPPNALSDDIPAVGGYGFGLNVWSTGSALAVEELFDCGANICGAATTLNGRDAGSSCKTATSCSEGFVASMERFVVVAITLTGPGASTASVYVDGVLFDQVGAVVPPTDPAPPLHLGRHNLDTQYGTERVFAGRIRDVRVYKRTLGAPEVKKLFENGPTLQAPGNADAGSDAGPTEGGPADGAPFDVAPSEAGSD